MSKPYAFVDVGPLVPRRMESINEVREKLSQVLKVKWKNATEAADCDLPKLMEGEGIRQNLKEGQALCKGTRELMKVQ